MFKDKEELEYIRIKDRQCPLIAKYYLAYVD